MIFFLLLPLLKFSLFFASLLILLSPIWSSRSPPHVFCINRNSQRKNSGFRWIQYYRSNPAMCVWREPCILTDNNSQTTNKIEACYFLSMWNTVGCTLFETHSWIPSAWFHFWERAVLVLSLGFCELSEREKKSANQAPARCDLAIAQYQWRLAFTRHANYIALLKFAFSQHNALRCFAWFQNKQWLFLHAVVCGESSGGRRRHFGITFF
jgi:hypothetical protein